MDYGLPKDIWAYKLILVWKAFGFFHMWHMLDLVLGKHFHTNFKSRADFYLVYGRYKTNIDALPISLIDSNVSLRWKQRKNKELGHVLCPVAFSR
jgi:hypothetical protein